MNFIQNIIARFKQEVNQDLLAKVEAESAARRKRNEERMEQIKKDMGEKYIMHPSHTRGRLDEPRPV